LDSIGPSAARSEGADDEEQLTADIVELARRHGRLGYRKIEVLGARCFREISRRRAASKLGQLVARP
jgi:hypothetical protein